MNTKFTTYRFERGELAAFEVPVIFDNTHYGEFRKTIANSKHRCVLIISGDYNLINLVTQGDVMRFEENVTDHSLSELLSMKEPCRYSLNSSSASQIANEQNLSVVPIKNLDGTLNGVVIKASGEAVENVLFSANTRIALIVAGGKGTRLGELTKNIPKPLLRVGGKRLIEHVMSSVAYLGFDDFYLLCGHLIDAFESFSNDTDFDVKICKEDTPLGTGGPFIKWIKDYQSTLMEVIEQHGVIHLLIANGDLLFDLDDDIFQKFEDGGASFGIIGRRIKTEIKFGTMSIDASGNLIEFVEKPTIEHIVNTGVYFISIDLSLLHLLLEQEIKYIGMPDLLQTLSGKLGKDISVIEVSGNYLDLGTPDDLNKLKRVMEE